MFTKFKNRRKCDCETTNFKSNDNNQKKKHPTAEWVKKGMEKKHSHSSSTGGACRSRWAAAAPSAWGSSRTMSHTPVFPWWPSHHTGAAARGCGAPFPGAPATGRSPPTSIKKKKRDFQETMKSVCHTLNSGAIRNWRNRWLSWQENSANTLGQEN